MYGMIHKWQQKIYPLSLSIVEDVFFHSPSLKKKIVLWKKIYERSVHIAEAHLNANKILRGTRRTLSPCECYSCVKSKATCICLVISIHLRFIDLFITNSWTQAHGKRLTLVIFLWASNICKHGQIEIKNISIKLSRRLLFIGDLTTSQWYNSTGNVRGQTLTFTLLNIRKYF